MPDEADAGNPGNWGIDERVVVQVQEKNSRNRHGSFGVS
jgi:hypothetical protein